MHPLVGDLKELTDKDLGERLTKCMRIMRTIGSMNGMVYNQARMVYQSLAEEQQRRSMKVLEEQMKRSGRDDFNDIIDIG